MSASTAYRLMFFEIGPFKKLKDGAKRVTKMNQLFSYPIGFYHPVVYADSGIKTFKDIKGVPVTNIIRGADDFKAGKLDIGFFALGAPKMQEVNSAVGGIRWLSVRKTPASLKAMRSIRSEYYIATVKPSPVMAGVAGPTNVLAVDTLILVGTHVANDVVGKFVAAVHDNKGELVKGHPLFRAYNPKLMGKKLSTATYHPGAIAYYKKNGIWPGS